MKGKEELSGSSTVVVEIDLNDLALNFKCFRVKMIDDFAP